MSTSAFDSSGPPPDALILKPGRHLKYKFCRRATTAVEYDSTMSTVAAILALSALAAAGVVRQKQSRDPRPTLKGSRSKAPPAHFLSPENHLLGTTYYHGSEAVFNEFDPLERRTSYGIFFSPDPDTAGFYGNNLYTVLLFAKNAADFDDPLVLRKVAEETVWDDRFDVYQRDQEGDYTPVDNRDIARHVAPLLSAAAKASPRSARIISEWMDTYDLDADDKDDDAREEVIQELLEDEDFWTDHPLWEALPEAERKSFSGSFLRIHPEVKSIEESYGSNDFYLNHQDDMLKAAESLGYDAVIMADPSPVGESLSVVVFSGSQAFIVSRQSATPDPRRR